MIADYLTRDEVSRYVGALRERVAAGDLDEHAAPAAKAIGGDPGNAQATILAALPAEGAGEASSGGEHVNAPFFSRDPTVSLMQTSLELEARRSDLVHAPQGRLRKLIVRAFEELREILPAKFSTEDPEWVTRIGEATRFGFAVVDFNGSQATIRYRDDQGNQVLAEPLP